MTGSVSAACGTPQFSHLDTARKDAMSRGSSEPRIKSSISSALKRESAFPPHTVKNPRLKGSNWRMTATSSKYLTYRSTNSRLLAFVTGRFSPPGQRGTCIISPYLSTSATKSRQKTASTSPSKSRSWRSPLANEGLYSAKSSRQ